MASTEIITYIKQNLQLGYDLNSIKNSLISSGYTAQQINAAIDYVSAQGQYQGTSQSQFRKTSSQSSQTKLPPLPILIVGFLLIVALGIGSYFILGDSSTNTPIGTTYTPPQNLNPPTTTSGTTTDPIPNTGSTTANQPITNPQPTTPTPTQPQTSRDSPILTRLQIDQEVDKIAATQPDAALELCAQIITRAGTFICVTKVAFESQDPRYCENIVDFAAKDNCYMQFPVNEIGDVSVCQKVANEYKKNSCFELYDIIDQLSDIQATPQLSEAEIQAQVDSAIANQPTLEEYQQAQTRNAFADEEVA